MLNFVRRKYQQRLDDRWNRGVAAFYTLLKDTPPVGQARPLIRPFLRRVTQEQPYKGPFLEDDMTPATLPDGTALTTYMAEGFAMANLWVGHDRRTCQAWMDKLPRASRLRIIHPTCLLPVYRFTQEMSEILVRASGYQDDYPPGGYYVNYFSYSEKMFAQHFRWEIPSADIAHLLYKAA